MWHQYEDAHKANMQRELERKQQQWEAEKRAMEAQQAEWEAARRAEEAALRAEWENSQHQWEREKQAAQNKHTELEAQCATLALEKHAAEEAAEGA